MSREGVSLCLFGNNRSSKVLQFWSNPTQTLLPISLEKESFPEVTNGHKASDLDKDTLHLNGLIHMKRGIGDISCIKCLSCVCATYFFLGHII